MFTKPKCRSSGFHETHYLVEPEAGIGPATYALRVRCSTTELPGRVAHSTDLMIEKLLQLKSARQCAERRALK